MPHLCLRMGLRCGGALWPQACACPTVPWLGVPLGLCPLPSRWPMPSDPNGCAQASPSAGSLLSLCTRLSSPSLAVSSSAAFLLVPAVQWEPASPCCTDPGKQQELYIRLWIESLAKAEPLGAKHWGRGRGPLAPLKNLQEEGQVGCEGLMQGG